MCRIYHKPFTTWDIFAGRFWIATYRYSLVHRPSFIMTELSFFIEWLASIFFFFSFCLFSFCLKYISDYLDYSFSSTRASTYIFMPLTCIVVLQLVYLCSSCVLRKEVLYIQTGSTDWLSLWGAQVTLKWVSLSGCCWNIQIYISTGKNKSSWEYSLWNCFFVQLFCFDA